MGRFSFFGDQREAKIHFQAIFPISGRGPKSIFSQVADSQPLCCKNLCCASCFFVHAWAGKNNKLNSVCAPRWGSRSKNLLEGPMKANASSRALSEGLEEGREVGHHQHPDRKPVGPCFIIVNFCGHNGAPFLTQNPPKHVHVGCFFGVLSHEMRRTIFFRGSRREGFGSRATKVILKKFMCVFCTLLPLPLDWQSG